MSAADGILAIIGAGVVAYALLGGADFGGGTWDLLAYGRQRQRQRDLIAHTMGPVWEANHVWLVFVVIGLFSGFPVAFGALCRLLAVPLALALLGIVLRGAAFVFRQYGSTSDSDDPAVRGTAAWGRVFAIASALTPAVLGLCVGAAATGRLTGAFPPVAAALGFAFCAYLAAVYLCREAQTRGETGLIRDFRARALIAAAGAGVLAVAALAVLPVDAPDLSGRLWHRAGPLVALSVSGGLASIAALARYRFRLARAAAAVAVGSVLLGWGAAAYPYLVPPGITIADAAGPAATRPVILGVLVAGFAVTVPSLLLLYRIFSRPEPPLSG